jgi:hypothetical protein
LVYERGRRWLPRSRSRGTISEHGEPRTREALDLSWKQEPQIRPADHRSTTVRCLKDRPPASDLFGVKGRAWLAAQQLPLCERETVDSAIREVDFLDSEIAQVDKLIAGEALSWPEVKRLMTVPGGQRHRRRDIHGRRR